MHCFTCVHMASYVFNSILPAHKPEKTGRWKLSESGMHTRVCRDYFLESLWLLSSRCQPGKPLETLPLYILSNPLQTTVLIVHVYEILPFLWEISVKNDVVILGLVAINRKAKINHWDPIWTWHQSHNDIHGGTHRLLCALCLAALMIDLEIIIIAIPIRLLFITWKEVH